MNKSIASVLLALFSCLLGAGWASATYVFTYPTIPGGTVVNLLGINDTGQVAGIVAIGNNRFGVIYQSGVFVPLPTPPAGLSVAPLGINNAGIVVGVATGLTAAYPFWQGFILQNGTYAFFLQPGWEYTQARAISNSGLVTGFSGGFNDDNGVGFIYDPTRPPATAFTDIAPPSPALTIAQGINNAGQVVGDKDGLGFLRQPDGTITTFLVGNRLTAPRAINNNGLIAGFVYGAGAHQQGFVGNASGFELLSVPGAISTFIEGLNDAGQVTGSYSDAAGNAHGFIATPASLPSGTTASGAYTFNVTVVPNTIIFVDPDVTVGFDYTIGEDNPKFATTQLPIGIGDSMYTIIVHGKAFIVAGGDQFDFRAHGFPKGVSKFRVADIDVSAALDPANPAAFPTGLTFMAAGQFTGTMTPLCQRQPHSGHTKVPAGKYLSPCSKNEGDDGADDSNDQSD